MILLIQVLLILVFVALFGALFFERVSSEVILQLVIRSLFKLTGLIFIYIYIKVVHHPA